MKRLACLIGLLTLCLCLGCEEPQEPVCPDGCCPNQREIEPKCPYKAVPPVDLPKELRCANYSGGSCMHASLISLLRWQRQYALADLWRKSYHGGASVHTLASISERLGVDYAYTDRGDAEFLEWCSRTRRGAAMHYGPNHAQSFCGYDENGMAVILDNNYTINYRRVPKDQFLRAWRSYGGLALTPVYTPAPPRPWIPDSTPSS